MSPGHIFVSYERTDQEYVGRLIAWLSRAGVEVWFDRDIATGHRWENVLRERIESCQALLVVMTPSAAGSEWVAKEVGYARELNKPILPLRLAGEVLFDLVDIQAEDVRHGGMPDPEFAQRLRGVEVQRRVIRHSFGLVPREAQCFLTRRIADDMNEVLRGEAGSAVVILTGLGGVGKTQIAASAARRMRDAGELDLFLWVNAQSRDAILTAYADAAAQVVGADAANIEEAATSFLSHLAAVTSRWLVVLDDVTDPTDLDGWWPPQTTTSRVLVTTRRRDAALAGHGQMMTVGVFTPIEAHAYLATKFAENARYLGEADAMADDLGFLPVALAQAAAYIVDRGLTCAAYRARFADHPLATLAPGSWPDEYARSVAVTLSLAMDSADQLEPSGLARPLLAVLSLLDPDRIPTDLIGCAPVVDYLSRSSNQVIGVDQAHDALACLTRLNITTTMHDPDVVQVHSLVQRTARDQATGVDPV
jgi:hypothetical protein